MSKHRSMTRDLDRVPLMRPDEEAEVNRQSDAFQQSAGTRHCGCCEIHRADLGELRRPMILAYGTVVGDGTQVLTKWSEIERFSDSLQVQTSGRDSYSAKIVGCFHEEDLALLELGTGAMPGLQSGESPAKLTPANFTHPNCLSGNS